MRFFKKISPQVKLQLSTGQALQFVNVDGEWGILQVGNPGILAELEAAIKAERGGVFEISPSEYKDLEEKKTTSRQPWREEITKSGAAPRPHQIVPRPAPQNVAVSVENGFEPKPAAPVTPVKAPDYKPTATPRTS